VSPKTHYGGENYVQSVWGTWARRIVGKGKEVEPVQNVDFRGFEPETYVEGAYKERIKNLFPEGRSLPENIA